MFIKETAPQPSITAEDEGGPVLTETIQEGTIEVQITDDQESGAEEVVDVAPEDSAAMAESAMRKRKSIDETELALAGGCTLIKPTGMTAPTGVEDPFFEAETSPPPSPLPDLEERREQKKPQLQESDKEDGLEDTAELADYRGSTHAFTALTPNYTMGAAAPLPIVYTPIQPGSHTEKHGLTKEFMIDNLDRTLFSRASANAISAKVWVVEYDKGYQTSSFDMVMKLKSAIPALVREQIPSLNIIPLVAVTAPPNHTNSHPVGFLVKIDRMSGGLRSAWVLVKLLAMSPLSQSP
ncbi:hypothetical protein ARMSODRAFT_972877 [Armillaria solidipes]|uniref:Uncharacterized protein n=1 Tax=Armillaria solidipes TaxID=1076256 RepID=A0A2H3BRI9_9AGAR|nr:hypothetical protein ARMSODRAFT_972877 [Armillaria solidipes]